MNGVIAELNKFLAYMDWGNVDNLKFTENANYFIYRKQCISSEIRNIINYNFENLFLIFDSSLKIIFSHINEPTPFIISDKFNKQYANEYIEEMFIAHETINVELNINKNILKNKILNSEFKDKFNINLFFTDKMFLEYVNLLSYRNLENELYSQTQKTIIIIFNKTILFYNDLVLIIGGNKIIELENYIKNKFNSILDMELYKKIIRMRNEQCNWIDCPEWLCPEYMYFNFSEDDFIYNYELKQYFLYMTVNLAIPFIANYTNKENNKICSYINGYKKIKIYYMDNIVYDNNMVYFLFKQYNWAYEGNNSDKLSMLRNLMTIFLCEECESSYYQLILINSEDIYKSVKNNFDIYLKNNVKEYFTETHKVREMVSNKLKEISDEISDLIGNMNKNFLATIGVILGAAIGYLTKGNIYILKISAMAYGIFIFLNASLTIPYYKKRINDIQNDYTEHLKMFSKIVLPKHMPEYGISGNVKVFNKYWFIYIGINFIILVLTFIFVIKTTYAVDFIKNILQ
ncbi:hypothetical protein [Clostridium sp. BJN0013]|jgi:hypothetical protein|uniref:hypothetical protein n=1 Tax=Clostridium sp. BJN0013 TaxID=3236840 RepID=UPI0034C674B6